MFFKKISVVVASLTYWLMCDIEPLGPFQTDHIMCTIDEDPFFKLKSKPRAFCVSSSYNKPDGIGMIPTLRYSVFNTTVMNVLYTIDNKSNMFRPLISEWIWLGEIPSNLIKLLSRSWNNDVTINDDDGSIPVRSSMTSYSCNFMAECFCVSPLSSLPTLS